MAEGLFGAFSLSSGTTPAHAGGLGASAMELQSDPYGPNPLVTDLSIRNQTLFELASARATAPTLFASGDLPPFTASGVDPQVLTRLPFTMRHAAAAERDAGKVLALVEECAGDPSRMGRGVMNHPGMDEYRERMNHWISGLKIPDVPLGEATYPDQWKTPSMRAKGA
jgi:hypothetical protein